MAMTSRQILLISLGLVLQFTNSNSFPNGDGGVEPSQRLFVPNDLFAKAKQNKEAIEWNAMDASSPTNDNPDTDVEAESCETSNDKRESQAENTSPTVVEIKNDKTKISSTFYTNLTLKPATNTEDGIIACFADHLKIDKAQVKITSINTDGDEKYIYLHQEIHGRKIVNAWATLLYSKGFITSIGSSFYPNLTPPNKTEPQTGEKEAVELVEKYVGGKFMHHAEDTSPEKEGLPKESLTEQSEEEKVFKVLNFSCNKVEPILAYLQTVEPSGERLIHLVWTFNFCFDDNLYEVYVDAELNTVPDSNRILSLSGSRKQASYKVFPLGVNDAMKPKLMSKINTREDKNGLKRGWHTINQFISTKTQGNNAIAQQNYSGKIYDLTSLLLTPRPNGLQDLDFSNFSFDPTLKTQTDIKNNIDAAICQAFCIVNILHDIFYTYGFDEDAGNFQAYNFGGEEGDGDPVIVNVQYKSDIGQFGGSSFLTPEDGKMPEMRLRIYKRTDGTLWDIAWDNGIVIHESVHGLADRLVGGRKTINCLKNDESAGLAEGWCDVISIVFRINAGTKRNASFLIGEYIKGRGMRRYPYTGKPGENPTNYSQVNSPECQKDPHAMGEIWASTLFDIFWDLQDACQHGEVKFNPNWYKVGPAVGMNQVFMELVIQGMKGLTCRPDFINARDGILKADEVKYGGRFKELLWKAFAKRGLGVDAEYPGKACNNDNFKVKFGAFSSS